uniref:Trypsin-like proteinase n=1 Tax=Chilo suppressalis TaxID=168631 RepID=I3UIJ2_CHISP|nr:trypsin-like proteinase [Chilo suppressalis]
MLLFLIWLTAIKIHSCFVTDGIILSEKVSVSSEDTVVADDPLPVVSSDRIVGGQEIDIIEVPYQVSFIVNNLYFCGGFIVSEKHILTAGHCAQNVDPSTVVLRAGSTWRKNGTIIPIAKVTPHPQYDDPAFDKDVAVMQTVEPMNFDETMQPIPLAPMNRKMKGGTEIVVSGWGRTREGAPTIPDHLMAVQIPVVTWSQCYTTYFGVTNDDVFGGDFFLVGREATCGDD